MGYWVTCGKCGRELYLSDYRGKIGDLDYEFCRECTDKIEELIEKWISKKDKK